MYLADEDPDAVELMVEFLYRGGVEAVSKEDVEREKEAGEKMGDGGKKGGKEMGKEQDVKQNGGDVKISLSAGGEAVPFGAAAKTTSVLTGTKMNTAPAAMVAPPFVSPFGAAAVLSTDKNALVKHEDVTSVTAQASEVPALTKTFSFFGRSTSQPPTPTATPRRPGAISGWGTPPATGATQKDTSFSGFGMSINKSSSTGPTTTIPAFGSSAAKVIAESAAQFNQFMSKPLSSSTSLQASPSAPAPVFGSASPLAPSLSITPSNIANSTTPVPKPQPKALLTLPSAAHDRQTKLLALIILATKTSWPALHDAAIDVFVSGELLLNRVVPMNFLTKIYGTIHASSEIKKFIADRMISGPCGEGDMSHYAFFMNRFDGEMAKDFLGRMRERFGGVQIEREAYHFGVKK